ncbi:hypothetical protein GPECTOR_16g585 [Gonium pectorale]|uniref:Protein-tyrosine sulfotransferase n=1 Tax=Gonium pectorale TaxID=33097 RepID=A0A150GKT9_GONPE|nr:hypothetical protein GPECTOR_16g585 [Gonium pectorale]|eukprot:KXZ50411.1 hypothetical protein GPECTOR_16g585 [Gonium pectorale]
MHIRRCLMVLATGRSGSTALVDALNQLPNYFIRGEHKAAFHYLYLTWRCLKFTWSMAREFRNGTVRVLQAASASADDASGAGSGAAAAASRALSHVPFDVAKQAYNSVAPTMKLPWFSDVHPDRTKEAMRSFYGMLYGYQGAGFVSGFKEIRYVRNGRFPVPNATYVDFADFIAFLRNMCVDVKVLLNTRAKPDLASNRKLHRMMGRNHGASAEAFEENMRITHVWYASENPQHSMRVLMEDMFDPKVNATLARNILTFLGEDPNARIDFARMPTWSADGQRQRRRRRGHRRQRRR